MRRAALASLASCIFLFAACGDDDNPVTTGSGDGGVGSSSGASSGGTGTSSGGASSSGNVGPDGGPIGDDDDDVVDDPAIAKLPPSCRAAKGKGPGINTCGAGDAASDDCCKSLTLPTTATRALDKYEITSGRMRSFVEANPDVRKFAKDFAAAHPESQLGQVAKAFPAKGQFGSYLDTLPNHTGAAEPLDLAVFLGAFPADTINEADGCFVSPGGYGAATYWQPPENLKPYGVGLTKGGDGKPDGTRKYDKSVLDKKAINCVSAMMLATFCAWDGGELARTSDFHAVWGRQQVKLPGASGATVFVPWNDVLPWGEFNWRNGHNGACPAGWPKCAANPGVVFFSSPSAGVVPKDDDSPEVAEPGRMVKDVTKAVSPDGSGWFDVGGNLMDQAWPNKAVTATTEDFCETAAGAGAGALRCNRSNGPGTLRYEGKVPGVVLVGYSFEVHSRRAEKYLSAATEDEANLAAGDIKPAHFQYGKIGGRCARVK